MLRNSSVTVKTIHFSEEQHNRVRLARRKRHCITKWIMASRGPQMWQQKEFPNCLYDTVASFALLWDNTVHCSISHSAVTHHIPVLRPDKWKASAGQLRLKCSSLSPAVTLQPVWEDPNNPTGLGHYLVGWGTCTGCFDSLTQGRK